MTATPEPMTVEEPIEIQDLRRSAEAAMEIFAEESTYLQQGADAEILRRFAKAKALAADRFEKSAKRAVLLGEQARILVRTIGEELMVVASENERILRRKLEIVTGLLSALEESRARQSHARMVRYTKDGVEPPKSSVPVAFDTQL